MYIIVELVQNILPTWYNSPKAVTSVYKVNNTTIELLQRSTLIANHPTLVRNILHSLKNSKKAVKTAYKLQNMAIELLQMLAQFGMMYYYSLTTPEVNMPLVNPLYYCKK